MKLTKSERELIELLRSGKPFAVYIMLKEIGGEWVASTSTPPWDAPPTKIGVAVNFAEAWSTRRIVPENMRSS